ncbi:MAG: hypothetical protein ACE5EK_03080 [Nitrospinales bacterium]
MKLENVLQELIQHLNSQSEGTIAWEQVREWPEGAVSIFQKAGWIKTKAPAKTVVCPGCEENCFMPVHVSPTIQGQPAKAYVACDRRDDMGRIPISPDYLQQWQITENQVAHWVARELGLKGKPKKDKTTRTIQIGDIQGKKQSGRLDLVTVEPVSLKTSGHILPLNEIIFFESNELQIDREAILNMVDRSPPTDRYQPSIARREARKLKTQEMYKSWRKAYQELKKNRRNMSDTWYSQQIAKMDVAKGRDSETIRRNMKK